jgi:hypothetical protein
MFKTPALKLPEKRASSNICWFFRLSKLQKYSLKLLLHSDFNEHIINRVDFSFQNDRMQHKLTRSQKIMHFSADHQEFPKKVQSIQQVIIFPFISGKFEKVRKWTI